jgi:hypothetical protein
VYHITSAKHAISNIALARIKLARFSDANDPFELTALNLRESRVRKVHREWRDAYTSRTGILCFSEDWTNPVLWSHYGDKHRGICLGFDLLRVRAQKVNYQPERILRHLEDDADDPSSLTPELQEDLIRTKFHHWEYEREVRVFVSLADAVQEGRLHFIPFDSSLRLAEVILGTQCALSLDDVKRFTKAHHPDIVTYRARLAFKFFKIVPLGTTVP